MLHSPTVIRRPGILALVVLTLVALAPPLGAEMLAFDLDPGATRIEFRFGATLHTVTGTLRAKPGRLRFDPQTGEADGLIVLDATSAETGNARRDEKMHEKILESARYPEMLFELRRVSGELDGSGTSDLVLHGNLTMHGVERPLDLVVRAEVAAGRVTATGRTTIPYLDWGLEDPSFFVLRVAKEVDVEVTTSGRLVAAEPGSAAPSGR